MRAHRVITTIWTSCVASATASSWVFCSMFYVQRFLSEPVRPGTVVSVLFLIVLFSANLGIIPSLAASITAALFFVTYFQPPLGRFAATPRGWVSTASFVLASVIVSQLSAKARRSAAEATGAAGKANSLSNSDEAYWLAVVLQKRGGMALGVDGNYPYQSTTVQLNSGDTLFLYTDAVTEARNGDNEMFKTGGTESALATNDRTTCVLLCDAMMKRLGQFVHGTPQSDDITMLAVSYRQ